MPHKIWPKEAFWKPAVCRAGAKPREQPAVLLLLLARTCIFMHSTALPHVMETLAATFPGQGGSSGSGQPPAFVAGQVGK